VTPSGPIKTAHERPWATVLRVPVAEGAVWFKACAPVQACDELAADAMPATIQHDDLHMGNVYVRDERLRILDWGDSSIAHPFASLVVTFRFLEEINGLAPDDPWFRRLRDAYLEPWGGTGLDGTFALALRVGTFAHTFAWARQRDHLSQDDRREFNRTFPIVLRRAVAETRA
jgi:aminoglycoside phosphotransferase (APT) family kinase protein